MKSAKKYYGIIIVLAVLVIASVAFLMYQHLIPKEELLCAVISVGGVEVYSVDLSKDAEPYEIDLDAQFGVGVVLEVEGHEIHFKSSDCPDQICIHAGWLKQDMDIAVCMPNQVSVVVLPAAELKK